MTPLSFTPVPGIPEIHDRDDLGAIICAALQAAQLSLADHDIVVISQKIVSKAENRKVKLATVQPSRRARIIARQADKDPALVEMILRESRQVLRVRPGLIIVEHRLGLVMANAGIDVSNIGAADEPSVLLLPVDPDSSAAELRQSISQRLGVPLGVLIIDSAGRAWRAGVVGIAIGSAGVPPLIDLRGTSDRDARPLNVTEVAIADQIAAGASLLMGEAAEGLPVVIVRGVAWRPATQSASALVRAPDKDLFRQ